VGGRRRHTSHRRGSEAARRAAVSDSPAETDPPAGNDSAAGNDPSAGSDSAAGNGRPVGRQVSRRHCGGASPGRRLKSRPLDGISGAGASNDTSDVSGHPRPEIAPEISIFPAARRLFHIVQVDLHIVQVARRPHQLRRRHRRQRRQRQRPELRLPGQRRHQPAGPRRHGRHRREGGWHGHLAHVWHGHLARDFRGRPRPGRPCDLPAAGRHSDRISVPPMRLRRGGQVHPPGFRDFPWRRAAEARQDGAANRRAVPALPPDYSSTAEYAEAADTQPTLAQDHLLRPSTPPYTRPLTWRVKTPYARKLFFCNSLRVLCALGGE